MPYNTYTNTSDTSSDEVRTDESSYTSYSGSQDENLVSSNFSIYMLSYSNSTFDPAVTQMYDSRSKARSAKRLLRAATPDQPVYILRIRSSDTNFNVVS
jgi:hypothetical protein